MSGAPFTVLTHPYATNVAPSDELARPVIDLFSGLLVDALLPAKFFGGRIDGDGFDRQMRRRGTATDTLSLRRACLGCLKYWQWRWRRLPLVRECLVCLHPSAQEC